MTIKTSATGVDWQDFWQPSRQALGPT